jgi:isoleucyl-tRNA synthetase
MLFEKYGADATRWYLVTNSPPWRPTLFDEDGLVEVQRKFFGTLLNTYSFFALYANIDGFNFADALIDYEERPEIDRWIISKLNELVKEYERLMNDYDVTKAARAVSNYTIDQLSNWYVRRSRRRFWKSEMNKEKLSAYQTLYECLSTVCKLTAPFAPFISEAIYLALNNQTKREKFESIHLTGYPNITYRDKTLEEKMEVAQNVVYLTRTIRAKNNLKVRQPLKKIMVSLDKSKHKALSKMKEVILEEVNIKELIILSDDSEIVNKSAKANFKSIGPKFGKKVKVVAEMIKNFTKAEISNIEEGNDVVLNVEDEKLIITKNDVDIINSEITGWVVETEAGITVAIDKELDQALIEEGLAREFVNRIQNMRKDAGFDVTDKIIVSFTASEKFVKAISNFNQYISTETLAEKLSENSKSGSGITEQYKIGEYDCSINIEKVKS